jgi:polysaccharide export outer membrane protein
MTLQTAIAVSGGYTFRAEKDYAVVTRTVNDEVIEGTAGPSTRILPGDAIQIFESWF